MLFGTEVLKLTLADIEKEMAHKSSVRPALLFLLGTPVGGLGGKEYPFIDRNLAGEKGERHHGASMPQSTFTVNEVLANVFVRPYTEIPMWIVGLLALAVVGFICMVLDQIHKDLQDILNVLKKEK